MLTCRICKTELQADDLAQVDQIVCIRCLYGRSDVSKFLQRDINYDESTLIGVSLGKEHSHESY